VFSINCESGIAKIAPANRKGNSKNLRGFWLLAIGSWETNVKSNSKSFSRESTRKNANQWNRDIGASGCRKNQVNSKGHGIRPEAE